MTYYSEDAERVEAAIAGVRPTSTGWVHAPCFWCEESGHRDRKRSLHVNPATGRFRCWRCGERGRIRPQDDLPAQAPKPKPGEDLPMDLPDGFTPLYGEGSWDVQRGWKYLVDERGISEEAVKALGIGACPPRRTPCSCCPDRPRCRWQGRVIVPHVVDGDCRGWVGRQWVAKSKFGLPYLYPPNMKRTLYNSRVLHEETNEPALAVEGALDAAHYWDRACAFFGSPAPMHLDEMKERARRPVAVVLDGDVPDKCLMFALQLQFAGLRAGAVILPPRTDPDEVPREALLDAARRCIGLREGIKL